MATGAGSGAIAGFLDGNEDVSLSASSDGAPPKEDLGFVLKAGQTLSDKENGWQFSAWNDIKYAGSIINKVPDVFKGQYGPVIASGFVGGAAGAGTATLSTAEWEAEQESAREYLLEHYPDHGEASDETGDYVVAATVAFDGTELVSARGLIRSASRFEANDLKEQLAPQDAKTGQGTRFIQGLIRDAKFPESRFAKIQFTLTTADERTITIHYWRDLQTGENFGFKFK